MLFKKKIPIDWNLNYEFIEWLNKWFKEYRKNAIKIVDLEYYTYKYRDKELTQLQIIDRIIELTDILTDDNHYFNFEEEDILRVDEIFDLFRLVFWNMWW